MSSLTQIKTKSGSKSYLLLIRLLLAGLPLQIASSVSAGECPPVLKTLFVPQVHSGHRINPKDFTEELPYSKLNYDIYKLGEGGTGEVYRLIPKNNPKASFVVKTMLLEQAVHDTAALVQGAS